ncbi:hypothetical protein [Rhodovulum sulfidophilum]|uniref:hypothetical protein n=1 Tax=Rhodovulum sulfidophilum TaxID=35806 RepID=UPI000951BEE3|nr:hypothetical protein [Rhodovulum sulfidophilum]MBL3552575.1 hypothetical protein [Rhodovulum sulfidophilum]OLS46848.1 hypothetical protein BV379_00110 [Rhodovulum sulfidophilum]
MSNTFDVRVTLPWWRVAIAFGAAHMTGLVAAQMPSRWVEAAITNLARWAVRWVTLRMVL